MYKLLCSNLTKSHRSLTNFTRYYRKVAEKYTRASSSKRYVSDTDLQDTPVKEKVETVECPEEVLETEISRKPKTKSYCSFFAQKVEKSPLCNNAEQLMVATTSIPSRFIHSSSVDNREYDPPNRKNFKSREAQEYYKTALDQCAQIRNNLDKINEQASLASKPPKLIADIKKEMEKKESMRQLDVKRPRPAKKKKTLIKAIRLDTPELHKTETAKPSKTYYQFKPTNFNITYPTNTVSYKLGSYRIERKVKKKALTENEAPKKLKMLYPDPVPEALTSTKVKHGNASEEDISNLKQWKFKTKQIRLEKFSRSQQNRVDVYEEEKLEKAVIQQHPTVRQANSKAKMAFKSRYNRLLQKSGLVYKGPKSNDTNQGIDGTDGCQETKPQESTPSAPQVEINKGNVEEIFLNSYDTQEPQVNEHPIDGNKQVTFDIPKQSKRILSDKSDTFDIEAMCIKNNINSSTTTNYGDYVIESDEKIKNFVESYKQDPLNKPTTEKTSAQEEESKSNSENTSLGIGEYLKKLRELRDQTALDNLSFIKHDLQPKVDLERTDTQPKQVEKGSDRKELENRKELEKVTEEQKVQPNTTFSVVKVTPKKKQYPMTYKYDSDMVVRTYDVEKNKFIRRVKSQGERMHYLKLRQERSPTTITPVSIKPMQSENLHKKIKSRMQFLTKLPRSPESMITKKSIEPKTRNTETLNKIMQQYKVTTSKKYSAEEKRENRKLKKERERKLLELVKLQQKQMDEQKREALIKQKEEEERKLKLKMSSADVKPSYVNLAKQMDDKVTERVPKKDNLYLEQGVQTLTVNEEKAAEEASKKPETFYRKIRERQQKQMLKEKLQDIVRKVSKVLEKKSEERISNADIEAELNLLREKVTNEIVDDEEKHTTELKGRRTSERSLKKFSSKILENIPEENFERTPEKKSLSEYNAEEKQQQPRKDYYKFMEEKQIPESNVTKPAGIQLEEHIPKENTHNFKVDRNDGNKQKGKELKIESYINTPLRERITKKVDTEKPLSEEQKPKKSDEKQVQKMQENVKQTALATYKSQYVAKVPEKNLEEQEQKTDPHISKSALERVITNALEEKKKLKKDLEIKGIHLTETHLKELATTVLEELIKKVSLEKISQKMIDQNETGSNRTNLEQRPQKGYDMFSKGESARFNENVEKITQEKETPKVEEKFELIDTKEKEFKEVQEIVPKQTYLFILEHNPKENIGKDIKKATGRIFEVKEKLKSKETFGIKKPLEVKRRHASEISLKNSSQELQELQPKENSLEKVVDKTKSVQVIETPSDSVEEALEYMKKEVAKHKKKPAGFTFSKENTNDSKVNASKYLLTNPEKIKHNTDKEDEKVKENKSIDVLHTTENHTPTRMSKIQFENFSKLRSASNRIVKLPEKIESIKSMTHGNGKGEKSTFPQNRPTIRREKPSPPNKDKKKREKPNSKIPLVFPPKNKNDSKQTSSIDINPENPKNVVIEEINEELDKITPVKQELAPIDQGNKLVFSGDVVKEPEDKVMKEIETKQVEDSSKTRNEEKRISKDEAKLTLQEQKEKLEKELGVAALSVNNRKYGKEYGLQNKNEKKLKGIEVHIEEQQERPRLIIKLRYIGNSESSKLKKIETRSEDLQVSKSNPPKTTKSDADISKPLNDITPITLDINKVETPTPTEPQTLQATEENKVIAKTKEALNVPLKSENPAPFCFFKKKRARIEDDILKKYTKPPLMGYSPKDVLWKKNNELDLCFMKNRRARIEDDHQVIPKTSDDTIKGASNITKILKNGESPQGAEGDIKQKMGPGGESLSPKLAPGVSKDSKEQAVSNVQPTLAGEEQKTISTSTIDIQKRFILNKQRQSPLKDIPSMSNIGREIAQRVQQIKVKPRTSRRARRRLKQKFRSRISLQNQFLVEATPIRCKGIRATTQKTHAQTVSKPELGVSHPKGIVQRANTLLTRKSFEKELISEEKHDDAKVAKSDNSLITRMKPVQVKTKKLIKQDTKTRKIKRLIEAMKKADRELEEVLRVYEIFKMPKSGDDTTADSQRLKRETTELVAKTNRVIDKLYKNAIDSKTYVVIDSGKNLNMERDELETPKAKTGRKKRAVEATTKEFSHKHKASKSEQLDKEYIRTVQSDVISPKVETRTTKSAVDRIPDETRKKSKRKLSGTEKENFKKESKSAEVVTRSFKNLLMANIDQKLKKEEIKIKSKPPQYFKKEPMKTDKKIIPTEIKKETTKKAKKETKQDKSAEIRIPRNILVPERKQLKEKAKKDATQDDKSDEIRTSRNILVPERKQLKEKAKKGTRQDDKSDEIRTPRNILVPERKQLKDKAKKDTKQDDKSDGTRTPRNILVPERKQLKQKAKKETKQDEESDEADTPRNILVPERKQLKQKAKKDTKQDDKSDEAETLRYILVPERKQLKEKETTKQSKSEVINKKIDIETCSKKELQAKSTLSLEEQTTQNKSSATSGTKSSKPDSKKEASSKTESKDTEKESASSGKPQGKGDDSPQNFSDTKLLLQPLHSQGLSGNKIYVTCSKCMPEDGGSGKDAEGKKEITVDIPGKRKTNLTVYDRQVSMSTDILHDITTPKIQKKLRFSEPIITETHNVPTDEINKNNDSRKKLQKKSTETVKRRQSTEKTSSKKMKNQESTSKKSKKKARFTLSRSPLIDLCIKPTKTSRERNDKILKTIYVSKAIARNNDSIPQEKVTIKPTEETETKTVTSDELVKKVRLTSSKKSNGSKEKEINKKEKKEQAKTKETKRTTICYYKSPSKISLINKPPNKPPIKKHKKSKYLLTKTNEKKASKAMEGKNIIVSTFKASKQLREKDSDTESVYKTAEEDSHTSLPSKCPVNIENCSKSEVDILKFAQNTRRNISRVKYMLEKQLEVLRTQNGAQTANYSKKLPEQVKEKSKKPAEKVDMDKSSQIRYGSSKVSNTTEKVLSLLETKVTNEVGKIMVEEKSMKNLENEETMKKVHNAYQSKEENTSKGSLKIKRSQLVQPKSKGSLHKTKEKNPKEQQKAYTSKYYLNSAFKKVQHILSIVNDETPIKQKVRIKNKYRLDEKINWPKKPLRFKIEKKKEINENNPEEEKKYIDTASNTIEEGNEVLVAKPIEILYKKDLRTKRKQPQGLKYTFISGENNKNQRLSDFNKQSLKVSNLSWKKNTEKLVAKPIELIENKNSVRRRKRFKALTIEDEKNTFGKDIKVQAFEVDDGEGQKLGREVKIQVSEGKILPKDQVVKEKDNAEKKVESEEVNERISFFEILLKNNEEMKKMVATKDNLNDKTGGTNRDLTTDDNHMPNHRTQHQIGRFSLQSFSKEKEVASNENNFKSNTEPTLAFRCKVEEKNKYKYTAQKIRQLLMSQANITETKKRLREKPEEDEVKMKRQKTGMERNESRLAFWSKKYAKLQGKNLAIEVANNCSKINTKKSGTAIKYEGDKLNDEVKQDMEAVKSGYVAPSNSCNQFEEWLDNFMVEENMQQVFTQYLSNKEYFKKKDEERSKGATTENIGKGDNLEVLPPRQNESIVAEESKYVLKQQAPVKEKTKEGEQLSAQGLRENKYIKIDVSKPITETTKKMLKQVTPVKEKTNEEEQLSAQGLRENEDTKKDISKPITETILKVLKQETPIKEKTNERGQLSVQGLQENKETKKDFSKPTTETIQKVLKQETPVKEKTNERGQLSAPGLHENKDTKKDFSKPITETILKVLKQETPIKEKTNERGQLSVQGLHENKETKKDFSKPTTETIQKVLKQETPVKEKTNEVEQLSAQRLRENEDTKKDFSKPITETILKVLKQETRVKEKTNETGELSAQGLRENKDTKKYFSKPTTETMQKKDNEAELFKLPPLKMERYDTGKNSNMDDKRETRVTETNDNLSAGKQKLNALVKVENATSTTNLIVPKTTLKGIEFPKTIIVAPSFSERLLENISLDENDYNTLHHAKEGPMEAKIEQILKRRYTEDEKVYRFNKNLIKHIQRRSENLPHPSYKKQMTAGSRKELVDPRNFDGEDTQKMLHKLLIAELKKPYHKRFTGFSVLAKYNKFKDVPSYSKEKEKLAAGVADKKELPKKTTYYIEKTPMDRGKKEKPQATPKPEIRSCSKLCLPLKKLSEVALKQQLEEMTTLNKERTEKVHVVPKTIPSILDKYKGLKITHISVARPRKRPQENFLPTIVKMKKTGPKTSNDSDTIKRQIIEFRYELLQKLHKEYTEMYEKDLNKNLGRFEKISKYYKTLTENWKNNEEDEITIKPQSKSMSELLGPCPKPSFERVSRYYNLIVQKNKGDGKKEGNNTEVQTGVENSKGTYILIKKFSEESTELDKNRNSSKGIKEALVKGKKKKDDEDPKNNGKQS